MQPAADQIKAERNRQIMSEQYTEKKDIGRENDLVWAAIAYAEAALFPSDTYSGLETSWPWDAEYFKPTTKVRNLIKAGALIAAAIDAINNSKDTDK